jgi:hypothetical protein
MESHSYENPFLWRAIPMESHSYGEPVLWSLKVRQVSVRLVIYSDQQLMKEWEPVAGAGAGAGEGEGAGPGGGPALACILPGATNRSGEASWSRWAKQRATKVQNRSQNRDGYCRCCSGPPVPRDREHGEHLLIFGPQRTMLRHLGVSLPDCLGAAGVHADGHVPLDVSGGITFYLISAAIILIP